MENNGQKRARSIEKSCEITVNLGNMQFIKLKGQLGEDRPEELTESRLEAEGEMWDDLALDLRKGLRSCLKGLGKKTEAPETFADTCSEKLETETGKTT
jgi:hypothetical protein